MLALIGLTPLSAQQAWPPPDLWTPTSPTARPGLPRHYKVQPPMVVPEGEIEVGGVDQSREGSVYHLRGAAQIVTNSFLLRADEIDYNEETGASEARGHVYLQQFEDGDELWCDRAVYNLDDEKGTFYNVRGSAPFHVEARPHVLTSSNPFYFQGKWADRIGDKYLLHDGFITNCKMSRPWWKLTGPLFDVIPGERAIARHSVFRLRGVPLFYTPFYYKSLARLPRKSGLLAPNLGNSSLRGKMIGIGYYWAFSRSYDASYRGQYYSMRGFAHSVDLRGKPTHNSEFNIFMYGVNDRGVPLAGGGHGQKQGGVTLTADAKIDFSENFYGKANINYLSSFLFRQAFTESFYEAISSEVHSSGFLTRQWSSFSLDGVFQRLENFQSLVPDDTVVIRKLPEAEFSSRARRLFDAVPLWVSWESSGGLVGRTQLARDDNGKVIPGARFQTGNFLERADVYPRVTSFLHWGDFSFAPSFALRESRYGESRDGFTILGKNIIRSGREFDLDIRPPSLERVFHGKVKHVIETGIEYKYITGVDNFDRLIRFDETELYSNTNQVEVSLTNRLYVKRGDHVDEVLTWTLKQQRYFDPTFGGAIVSDWCGQPACRNVVLSSIELTPYAFLDGPRHYSPIVNSLRLQPKGGMDIEWRADYDPLRHRVVNNGINAGYRWNLYSVSVGQFSLRTVPALAPPTNQFRGDFRVGSENRRGWNVGFSAVYDFRVGILNYVTTQVAYNTDCCGFSAQYGRFSFGTRNENQFRVSLAIANVGSFGTLRKQERMF